MKARAQQRMSFIRYIGGKHRLSGKIAEHLKATGKDLLVDVFGGSGAVVMNSGFKRRVYNDKDGDLVNMFRVMQVPATRCELLRRCKWTLPSREMFKADHEIYKKGGLSFRLVEDPIDRALKTYFRASFCFGGKMRSGGFQISPCGREPIKEVARWNNMLKRFSMIGEFWRNTVIENKDFQDIISQYGGYKDTVLFFDPPYRGTENYYSVEFTRGDFFMLAHQLAESPAPAVGTLYDHPDVREAFPEQLWDWNPVKATKNSQNRFVSSRSAVEIILCKKVKHD